MEHHDDLLRAAQRLGVKEEVLWSEVRGLGGRSDSGSGASAAAQAPRPEAAERPRAEEVEFVKALLAHPALATELRGSVVLEEIENSGGEIILFIDELHTIVGAGGASGSLDASNMFKPALARGDLQCIGATTLDEYRQYIEKDGALDRRFQKIMVDPTTVDETIQILKNIKKGVSVERARRFTKDCHDIGILIGAVTMNTIQISVKRINTSDHSAGC